jgi:hypothetical protein
MLVERKTLSYYFVTSFVSVVHSAFLPGLEVDSGIVLRRSALEQADALLPPSPTSVGDVMAIPLGVGHSVSTSDYSAHLLVAYLKEPLLKCD